MCPNVSLDSATRFLVQTITKLELFLVQEKRLTNHTKVFLRYTANHYSLIEFQTLIF